MESKSQDLLKAKDIAKYLGVNIQTIWTWARKGTIPCFKFGESYRFRQLDVDDWLETMRVGGRGER